MSATFEVMSPATGMAVARVPDNGVADARAAAAKAVAAFTTWRKTTAYERSGILRAWASAIMAEEASLGRLMAQEMGKPVTEARGEVRYAVSFVEWYAEEAKRVYGTTIPSQAAHKRLLVQPQPVGPVYAITPWNFPAAMITRKAAPALAAGCTVVVKPAEQSPLTAVRLAELWVSSGGPADVFQVLPASDPAAVSRVFFDDPAIRKLSFTGSTEIGVLLAGQAVKTMKRISLELGGHAPFLVFADADIDAAVQDVFASKFRNAGQTCVCANRIYVHAEVHDRFVERFAAAAAGLRVGDPLDEATQIGPLVDASGLAKVRAHVDDALSKGARAVLGGTPGEGLTFMPTVLTSVAAGHADSRRRNVRPGRAHRLVHRRGRGHPARERHALRPGGLPVDAGFVARLPRRRGPRLRHRRSERRPAVDGAGAVWRHEDVRRGARGRDVGD